MNGDEPEIFRKQIRSFVCSFNAARPGEWHVEHLAAPRFVLTVTEPCPGAWLEESVHWIDHWSEIPEALNRELGAVFGEFITGQGKPV